METSPAMVEARKKLVVVLGMHRSGTSAMTRGLGVLGVGLGDSFIETLAGINDKGFWEDKDFNAINLELLRLLGVEWYSNCPIPPDRFDQPELRPLLERAVDLLRTKLDQAGTFGLKDPRTAILLPFWQRVFDALEVEAVYPIMIRNPASVADSLGKRDGFEPLKTHLLWLYYMVAGIVATQGRRRVVVDFDRLLDDPAGQLRRMAGALGLDGWDEQAYADYAHEFLSPGMRHTRYDPDQLNPGTDMPALVARVYAALNRAARDQASLDGEEIVALCAEAAGYLDSLRPCLRYMDGQEAQIRAGHKHAASTGQAARDMELRIATLSRESSDCRAELAALRNSAIWRWTAPYRQVRLWLKSRRG